MTAEPLNVVALISGGKDSFFSALHCLHHGHRLVALANLGPTAPDHTVGASSSSEDGDPRPRGLRVFMPGDEPAALREARQDLDSFMYQSAGHQLVPLYAAAAGLPLFVQPVAGRAVHKGMDYEPSVGLVSAQPRRDDDWERSGSLSASSVEGSTPHRGWDGEQDETESMLSLLQAVVAHHPEANAVCAGAILSTYQRTRVESVALRLSLTPLAFLWKYTTLPAPSPSLGSSRDDAQLLRDMAAAGLQARIVKVASGGLDERDLWRNVCSEEWIRRAKVAMSPFGAEEGSVLGEGGEFETLVVDGPAKLLRKRIVVSADDRIVSTGSSEAWLTFRNAKLEDKPGLESLVEQAPTMVRVPDLLDARFSSILKRLCEAPVSIPKEPWNPTGYNSNSQSFQPKIVLSLKGSDDSNVQYWPMVGPFAHDDYPIETETALLVSNIRAHLESGSLGSTAITNTTIVLRRMSDFPAVNRIYGSLFTRPNPPSRVTISCGDMLLKGRNILIFVTVQSSLPPAERKGLHVQSRSYWAPANIGPYSQAIDTPMWTRATPGDTTEPSPRIIAIAGQIPLVSASMMLPDPSPTSLELQITLSLQHLWRIGVEMHVQIWGTCTAYFSRTPDSHEMERKALLAAAAWKEAHSWTEPDHNEDTELDPWDRKYNSSFTSYTAGNNQGGDESALPDWQVLRTKPQEDGRAREPPFFAVEVEELPRGAAVEWHAHLGLAKLSAGMVQMSIWSGDAGERDMPNRWHVSHLLVECADRTFLHSCVQVEVSTDTEPTKLQSVWNAISAALSESVDGLTSELVGLGIKGTRPTLLYLDSVVMDALPVDTHTSLIGICSVIPCRTIWTGEGRRLAAVALFRREIEG